MTRLCNGKKHFFQIFNPHNNKQFWKAMKYLQKQRYSIPNLSHNNIISTMNQEKVNMLNHYFTKCFNTRVVEPGGGLHTRMLCADNWLTRQSLQLLCLMAVKRPLVNCYWKDKVESPKDYQKLQDNIHTISEWVSANHIHLNVSKCKLCSYLERKLS